MATSNRSIETKEHYHELTEKQTAIVDAIAENPGATDSEIADIASQTLEDDTVSRAYVPVVRSKQNKIIDQQTERKQGSDASQEDILGQLTEDTQTEDKSFQGFQDRPYSPENGLEITLDKTTVEQLIDGEVPDELRKEILSRVIEQAFN